MSLVKLLGKLAGKEIESSVSARYLFQRGLPYLLGLLRGFILRLFLGSCGKQFYSGKSVKILAKNLCHFGNNVRLEDYVKIDGLSADGIVLGNNVKLGEYSKIIGSGSINIIGKGLVIGNNSFFSEYSFFGAAGGISIGNDVIAGQCVRFHAENHNYDNLDKLIREQGVNHRGITVGNNCWIGAGAVFLDGSGIGNGCIVAANSVVTKNFPDNVILAGVPAKIISFRK